MFKFAAMAVLMALSYAPLVNAQAPAVGQLLSADPGVENGFTDWNQDWSGISSLNTATPLAGSASLRLGAAKGGRAQRIVSGIEGGAKYRVDGLAVVGSAGDVATLGVEFFNAAGTSILDQWVVITATSAQAYTFDVQIPNGTSSLNFYAFKNVGTQPSDFDNLSLTKLSNP